jgi:hypothetical protein
VNYLTLVQEASADAQRLETTYRSASQTGDGAAFGEAIHTCYAEAPDNLLYAAWHFRLSDPINSLQKTIIDWRLAILLSIPGVLIFWLLSDVERFQIHQVPLLALVVGPLSAGLIMAFLTLAGGREWRRLALIGLGLLAFVTYVIVTIPWLSSATLREQYGELMSLHLPLLAGGGIGLFVLWNNATPDNRFAFLIKSLEAVITGGLFLIGGAVFTAITFAMFEALGIEVPEVVARLFAAGGAGLAPVLAVAMVYRPGVTPLDQDFSQGVSRLISTLMRLLLPLTVLVLVVYLLFIPFYFWGPFRQREVLIGYNAMLFAVMGLLVAATPLREEDLSAAQLRWLRRGLLTVAGLAVLVSLYASAAIVYRTWQGGFTPNRLTIIGWNLINIALLLMLLFKQWQAQPQQWLTALRATISTGTVCYLVWGALVVIALPWLF